jgi:thioredoxin 1
MPNAGWKPFITESSSRLDDSTETLVTRGNASTPCGVHTGSIEHPRKEAIMAEGIVTLTTSTFDEIIAGADTPVVVDFWAEWCGPCKMIAPILSEIANEQSGKVTVAKLNVDENPDLAMRYNVMSIPTLLVFNKGELAKRLVGAKGKGQLLQELDEFLVTSH